MVLRLPLEIVIPALPLFAMRLASARFVPPMIESEVKRSKPAAALPSAVTPSVGLDVLAGAVGSRATL